ncbi:hypothetical protein LguiA_029144 [Lonicera macranthoides]
MREGQGFEESVSTTLDNLQLGKSSASARLVGLKPGEKVIYMSDVVKDIGRTDISQAPVSKWKSLKNRRLQNWEVFHTHTIWHDPFHVFLTHSTHAHAMYSSLGSWPRLSVTACPDALASACLLAVLFHLGPAHQLGPGYRPLSELGQPSLA